MLYQKTNTVGELNTDHISVGNWSSKMQGVSQFIEVGEGIPEGTEEELQENNVPMNNLNDLEDQPVGNDIEEEEHPTEEEEYLMEDEHPTTYTTTASGWVRKPPAHLVKEIGEATLTAAEQIIILLLVNCWKKMNLAALAWGLEVELTTQMS